MQSVFSDISQAFYKKNNQNNQLILACCFIFLIKFIAFSIFSYTTNPEIFSNFFNNNFIYSADFNAFLRHPWTLLFFPFTTQGVLNLVFNMLALYFFGNILMDFLGGRKTAIIYIGGALFAALYFIPLHALGSLFLVKSKFSNQLFGSSTGVYAVMFAAVALLPEYELSFFRVFVKLKYIALALLLFSFANPHIGILNLGGAIFGYINVKFMRSGWDITTPIESFLDWIGGKSKTKKRPAIRRSVVAPVGEMTGRMSIVEESEVPNQSEIDYLLDKISVSGYESLSKIEKHRLHKASQI